MRNDEIVRTNRLPLGLALSGGGSRAAAFHAGTLKALDEIGLVPSIDVVSTVSGGSIFGAAWMAAIRRGDTLSSFLACMRQQLQRGFVARSLSWRVLLLFVPGYTRSDLLAHTFDKIFFAGLTLDELPVRPRLCINTTVLNHGQVGKFANDGFSTADLGPPRGDDGSNVPVPLPKFRLARAAMASAAFPVGLPPILISVRELRGAARRGNLDSDVPLALTDGGVLENLGVQTLLKSRRFGTWDLIISDAGLSDKPWRPRSFGRWVTAFGIAALSASVLRRVLELMSDKESRSMRSLVMAEVERSWMRDQLATPGTTTAASGALRRRMLLFIRINQSWDSLIANVPSWRLRELSGVDPGDTRSWGAPDVTRFLRDHSVRLDHIREMYDELGGDTAVTALNGIGTGFTALSAEQLDGLERHARWQVQALGAIYGNLSVMTRSVEENIT